MRSNPVMYIHSFMHSWSTPYITVHSKKNLFTHGMFMTHVILLCHHNPLYTEAKITNPVVCILHRWCNKQQINALLACFVLPHGLLHEYMNSPSVHEKLGERAPHEGQWEVIISAKWLPPIDIMFKQSTILLYLHHAIYNQVNTERWCILDLISIGINSITFGFIRSIWSGVR